MKRNIALINGIIYSEYDIFRDKALLISGPTIRGIVDISDIPDGYEQADVGGSHICPGLIDLQIYGSGEELFSAELTVDSLHKIESHLLEQGCTSFILLWQQIRWKCLGELWLFLRKLRRRQLWG